MSSYLIEPTGLNVKLTSKEDKAEFKFIDAQASREGQKLSKKYARRNKFSNALKAKTKASETFNSALKDFNDSVNAMFHGNTLVDPAESLKYALIALEDVKNTTSKVEVLREEKDAAKAKARKAKAKAKKALKRAKSKLLSAKAKGSKRNIQIAEKHLKNLQQIAYEKQKAKEEEAKRIAAKEAKCIAEAELALVKAFNKFKAKKNKINVSVVHMINTTPFKSKSKAKKASTEEVAKAKVKGAARKVPKAHRKAMELIPSKIAQFCMGFIFEGVDGVELPETPVKSSKKAIAKAIKKAKAKARLAARRAIVKTAKNATALIKGAKVLAKLELANRLNQQAYALESSFGTFNDTIQRQFARQCIKSMGLQAAFMSDGNDVVDNTSNLQTSNTTERVVETENQSMKTGNEEVEIHGEKPFDENEMNAFIENAGRYYESLIREIKDATNSSLMAKPRITIKLFPSNDGDLTGFEGQLYHQRMPKITIGSSFQWASAFEAQRNQMIDWVAEMMASQDTDKTYEEIRDIVDTQIFPLSKEDVIYVQNLKDASDNKCDDKVVKSVLKKAGYYPVTPGLWLKETCKWAQNWIASNLGNVKEQRDRGRGMATTPITNRLDKDKDGNVILVMTYDFSKYQLEADGSNRMSHDLNTVFEDSIVQARCHNQINAGKLQEKQYSGFQGKGLFYRVEEWGLPTNGNRIYRLVNNKGEGAVPCIMLDIGNIKGGNTEGIKKAVANLKEGEMLCLNNWGGDSETKLYSNPENGEVTVLGGTIAVDSDGTSSISWQDTALYSIDTMEKMVSYFDKELSRKAKAFYTYQGDTLRSIIKSKEFLSAAAALKVNNPNTVNRTVFGASQKIKTKYCEQIAMPGSITIAKDDYIKGKGKKKNKFFTEEINGVTMYGCAIRRTPQLFHQCILHTYYVSHTMVKKTINKFEKYLANPNEVKLEGYFKWIADQFKEWMDQSTLFDDGYWSEFKGKHIEYAIEAFKRMATSFKYSPELIWMSKDNQDMIQADSDGDRILFTMKKALVQMAKYHVESIKDLPMIKPEVSSETPLDGGDRMKKVKNIRPFDYDADDDNIIDDYICAKDGGMGPVGFIINLCSVVLSKISWSTKDGQWGSHGYTWAFKFFAFLVLLVQNCIDRVKKPYVVAALNGWWEVDTSKIMVGGRDYEEVTTRETWPTMALGNEIKQVQSRSSLDEMYNLAGLKLFVCWTINLVKLNYKFDCPDQMMKDINSVAKAFANSTDEKPLNWQNVINIFGDRIDNLKKEELEGGWVWPDRLYAWKQEASLDVALTDAPPALNWLSELVVDTFNKVKVDKGLVGQPYELVREYLSANKNTKSSLQAGVWFCKDLFNALQGNRGAEYDEMATSEYYNAQASYDANKHLKDLKRAFEDVEGDSAMHNLAFKALKGNDVKERKEAVKQFMIALLRSWLTGYQEWLRIRKPFEWLKNTVTDKMFETNLQAKDKGDKLLNSLAEALKINAIKDDCYTAAAVKKQEALVSWLKTCPLDPKDIETVTGFGQVAVNNFCNWINRSTMSDTTKHWTEVLWEEWIPALEIQAELSEEQDDKTSLYTETEAIDGLVKLVMNNDETAIIESIRAQAKMFLVMTTNTEKLSAKNAEKLQACIDCKSFSAQQIARAKIGLLKKQKLNKFDKKYIVKMVQPIIAGLRLNDWLDSWVTLKSNFKKKEEVLTDCLLNQRSFTRIVDGETVLKTYKSLKSKVVYPVDPNLTATIASEFLKERSFYLLMKQSSLYITSSGEFRGSNAQRWVLWSKPQAEYNGDNFNTIYNQCLTGIGIGHCFNPSMLELIKSIVQKQVDAGNDPDGLNELKLSVINDVLNKQENFITMTQSSLENKPLSKVETIKRQYINKNVCIPYHWGGSAKANNKYGRSSVYRSTFRFVFSILGAPGEKQTDNEKALNFKMFEYLTDSTFRKKVVKLDDIAMDGNGIENAIVEALTSKINTTSNIVEKSTYQKQPRCPWTMPGFLMVFVDGKAEWMKPLKSPNPEKVGSVEATDYKIIKSVTPDGFFLSYYNKNELDEGGNPNLVKVVPFRAKPVGSTSWDATMVHRSIRGSINKLNGMNAPWIIASKIRSWKDGCFDLVKDNDLKEALSKAYQDNPDRFNRMLAEYLLGMLHTTSLIDTYSVSKFDEGEYKLSARMATKVPFFLKNFARSCHGVAPEISLGDNVIDLLLSQFGGK